MTRIEEFALARLRHAAEGHRIGMRVVVVDDQARMRFSIRSFVESIGYEVVAEAENGEHGIEQVGLHLPDVVVMDYRMPVMDGLAATEAIRDRFPDVQVIAYTSTDEPAIRDGFLAAGACDHVPKAEVDLLIAALKRCAAGG